MSKRISAWIATCLSFFLIQCAPVNPDVLREKPGAFSTFEVNLPLNIVYINEQRGFLGCMTGAYYQMTFAIQPRIDATRESASIVLVHHGAWKDIWAIVDLKADGERTIVHAYTTGHPLMRDFPDVAKRWASGDFTCQKYGITTEQYPFSE